MHPCFLAIRVSFAVRSIVNKSAYSLLEKKFLEFLISVRRLKVFMEAGNLETKTDTVFTYCTLADKKKQEQALSRCLKWCSVRSVLKAKVLPKCNFSVSETFEPKPEYDKRVQRKQS